MYYECDLWRKDLESQSTDTFLGLTLKNWRMNLYLYLLSYNVQGKFISFKNDIVLYRAFGIINQCIG